MPNKRNGVYKGKPRRDLRGFCSEEDRLSEVGVSGMSASSIPEENLNFLLDIFPNVDKEIIQAVLLEFNGSLNESIEKLGEISEEQSHQTMDKKSNDLAIIACSLLTDESQPDVVSPVLSNGPEDLANDLSSAALSSSVLQDQQNLDSNIRDYSLPVYIEESSGGLGKHLNPSALIRNGIVKNTSSAVNDNSLWLEKLDHAEVNNCKSHNIYGNENDKVFKPKPDFLNSSASSNSFIEESVESKSRKDFVNDLSWFPNISKATANSSSEPLFLNTGTTTNTDNSVRSIPYENCFNQEINNSVTEIKMQNNLDKKVYKADLQSFSEVNGTPDLTVAGNLNKADNLLNSWSNVLSEWDKFYSNIESDGYSTYCDSSKPTDVGRSGHNKKYVATSVAENSTHLHRSSAYSENETNRGQLRINKSQMKRDFKQKNSTAKAAAYVGNNFTFQNSGAVPSSWKATSSGLHRSSLASHFSPSAQNIAPFAATNSTGFFNSNLQTPLSSSAQHIGSSYFTVSREDYGNSKKETSSKLKLSPSALEFIPRPLASHRATPLAHSKMAHTAASSKNHKHGILDNAHPVPPRKKTPGNAKKGKHQKLNENTGSLSYGDQNSFPLPVRGDDHTSHSESRRNVDPMDPLGWSDIFSEATSLLLDPKPQRSRKARKSSGDNASQQPAPEPTFSPGHTPSEGHQNAQRSSPPKKQHQELPGEQFSTSFGTAGASTSYPVHTKSENGMLCDISSKHTISNSPIASRLPPSLASSVRLTAAVTAEASLFKEDTKMSSSVAAPKKILSESDVRTQRPAAVSTESQLLKNKLQFRGVRTPVGVIRRYILEKQPVMIILRGLPGSGKSYLAKQLIAESQQMGVQGVILSTDDFFTGVGQYCYNRNDLPEAHDWNKKRALQCVKEGRSPIIIDNTNTTMWELLPYAVLALEHLYDIQIFEPDTAWRMKVMELARKNVHGVPKDKIKRMKERWESFTLDDVIKQASHSVASRRKVTAVPADSTVVAPSPTGQHHPALSTPHPALSTPHPALSTPHSALNKQMTTPETTSVTETSHQNGSSRTPNPPVQDLVLSGSFGAQTSQPSRKMKQKVVLTMSQVKSPKHEITQDFLNQSLKKAIVNLRRASSPQAEDLPSNNNPGGLPVMNSSDKLTSSRTVPTERQLSDEDWNSDSQTPTDDADLQFFGKSSNDHASVPQSAQKEAVTAANGCSEDFNQNEEAVLNRSLSTSGSFRTVPSSSDISSYHTGDGDEDGVGSSADIFSDDDSGDTVPFEHDVQMLLTERQDDALPAAVVNAEDLPLQLGNMSLDRDEASFAGYVQHGSEKCSDHGENHGLEIVSSALELSKDHSGIVRGIPADSLPKESSTAADCVLNSVTVASADNIDNKKSCSDSPLHEMGTIDCLPHVICPSSLVNYSDSDGDDDDSGKEGPDDAVFYKEVSRLRIDDHAADPVNVCCGQAGHRVDTVDGSDCRQMEDSGYVRIKQSSGRGIGSAQNSEIIADGSGHSKDICVDGSVGGGESVGLVTDMKISLDGLVQVGENTIISSVRDREVSLDESTHCRDKPINSSIQNRENTVNRPIRDNNICLEESVQKAEINSAGVDEDREISLVGLYPVTEISSDRLVGREISLDRSVKSREISLDGLVSDREISLDESVQNSEDTINRSTEQVVINSVGLDKDREITAVDRSDEDRDSSDHGSSPDREPSIDRPTQGSEDSTHSGREQSPAIDSLAATADLQAKKKKKRIRKGRNPGPFIEESLKVKSKTQNWSSFVVQSSECLTSSGESVVLEAESQNVDTWSTTTQTDPYDFSLVYKLNSPAFNSLQPVDWTLRGVSVVSSSSKADILKKLQAKADEACAVLFRKTGTTAEQSTSTDETLEKEEADLETLKSCFPEYSRKQLEATMAICHNDLEWVTSHLLDSPALYDMEDEEEEGLKDGILKSEADGAVPRSSSSIRSLTDMCITLVKETNKVDADDLEMQVIQVGEGRLQKIEMFNRYRCHSSSHDDHGGKEYWPNDLSLDEIILTRAKSNFKKRKSLEKKQSVALKTSVFDHELSAQTSSSLSVSGEERPSALQEQGGQPPVPPSVFEGKGDTSSSPLVEVAASAEVNEPTRQAAVIESQPVLPLEFVKHLERLYGSLAISLDDRGLVLDDSTARRIYNCLKLQASKNVQKGSQTDQLKNDEALARALQDEENARTSFSTINTTSSLTADRQNTIPGWSYEIPSWMTPFPGGGLAGTGGSSITVSEGSEQFRPHSVADTLHRLRGGQGGRAQPLKFQHRKSASVKSVWTGPRRRGHVDSLLSIMQEEMAREEQQREQVFCQVCKMRIIESDGDMEALATRIKRIELSHLFPSMGPDILEDIFRTTGYSKEETIRVLYQSYNIPPVPMSQDKEEILNQLRKGHERFEHAEDLYDEDTPSEDSESSYEGYRDEARFCRQLAVDCQQQALRYQSNGMQGAALFYRQRAKKYREDEKFANSRAANVLFDKGSDRLQLENTLDLHFYRLDEAINAVNVAIELKEDEYRRKPDKKNSYLDIVTGWGRNSKNGKAKLKPAIIHHLYAKSFQYEEKSPGMLRVYLCKKL